MTKRAADALVLPTSKAQAKYLIRKEAEEEDSPPRVLNTQAPPAAAKEEETCRPYVGRDVKIRGELLGAKGWKNATVAGMEKGCKWARREAGETLASINSGGGRWWMLRIETRDGQHVIATVKDLQGKDYKLVPLAADDPRAVAAAQAKDQARAAQAELAEAATQQAANEAEWAHVKDRLGWVYLHEPPAQFQSAFLQEKNHHHMLAWLQTAIWGDVERSVGVKSLNKIHGQNCRSLGVSHQYAKQCLDRERTMFPKTWESRVNDLESYKILETA